MSNIPSTTQSLQARQFQQMPPPQVPQDLMKVLTEALAAEAVNKATQAAQNQLAQAGGQPQATIAEKTSAALQQAAQQNAQQKVIAMQGGLKGIQQAQAQPQMPPGAQIPQQGGAPQPQQPTVRAAQGGLMQVPSNLPRSYAGGGIIAFSNKGAVPDPDDPKNMSPFEAWLASFNKYGKGVHASAEDAARARAAVSGEEVATSEDTPPVADNAIPGARAEMLAQANANSIPAASASKNTPDVAKKGLPAALTDAKTSSGVSARTAGNVGVLGAMPQEKEGDAALNKLIQDRITGGINTDEEKAGLDALALKQKMTSGSYDDLMQARRDAMTKAQAGQAAVKAARGEGSTILGMNRDALISMGKNLNSHGVGGAFANVASDARDQGIAYRKEDAAFDEKIAALNDAMKVAAYSNDTDKYNTLATAKKEAIAQKNDALKSGVTFSDARTRALASERGSWDAAQARIQTAQIAAQVRADAKAAGADDKQLKLLDSRQTVAMRYAEAQASAQANMNSKTAGPEIDIPALTLTLYNRALTNDPVYQKIMGALKIPVLPSTAAAAPTKRYNPATGKIEAI
jgi:hypothetical protein